MEQTPTIQPLTDEPASQEAMYPPMTQQGIEDVIDAEIVDETGASTVPTTAENPIYGTGSTSNGPEDIVDAEIVEPEPSTSTELAYAPFNPRQPETVELTDVTVVDGPSETWLNEEHTREAEPHYNLSYAAIGALLMRLSIEDGGTPSNPIPTHLDLEPPTPPTPPTLEELNEAELTATIDRTLDRAENTAQAVNGVEQGAIVSGNFYQRAREMSVDDTIPLVRRNVLRAAVETPVRFLSRPLQTRNFSTEPSTPEAPNPELDMAKKNMKYILGKDLDKVATQYAMEMINGAAYREAGQAHNADRGVVYWQGSNGQGGQRGRMAESMRKIINSHPSASEQLDSELGSYRDLLSEHGITDYDPTSPRLPQIEVNHNEYSKTVGENATWDKYAAIMRYNALAEVVTLARSSSAEAYQQQNGTAAEMQATFDASVNESVRHFVEHETLPEGAVHDFFVHMKAMGNYVDDLDTLLAHSTEGTVEYNNLAAARNDAFQRMMQLRYKQEHVIVAQAEKLGGYNGPLTGLAEAHYRPEDDGVQYNETGLVLYSDGSYATTAEDDSIVAHRYADATEVVAA
jgi:hypothetical protein